MQCKILNSLTGAVVLASIGVAGALGAEQARWGYSGDEGPQFWGQLSKAYEPCGVGKQQSPVNLTAAVKTEIGDMNLRWKPAAWTVKNTGHTIELEAPNAGELIIDGKTYKLRQFHFHTPSEHEIDGKRFAMEAHFVFAYKNLELAVLGVMMEPGGDNDLFTSIMKTAPSEKGETALGEADLSKLIPGDGILRYKGSLTTPPCSEIVTWTVMTKPIRVRKADIRAFRESFPENARPLQPLNRRYVLTD